MCCSRRSLRLGCGGTRGYRGSFAGRPPCRRHRGAGAGRDSPARAVGVGRLGLQPVEQGQGQLLGGLAGAPLVVGRDINHRGEPVVVLRPVDQGDVRRRRRRSWRGGACAGSATGPAGPRELAGVINRSGSSEGQIGRGSAAPGSSGAGPSSPGAGRARTAPGSRARSRTARAGQSCGPRRGGTTGRSSGSRSAGCPAARGRGRRAARRSRRGIRRR